MVEPEFCQEPPPQLLLQGIAQFNAGEFYAQHDTLEELWMIERREGRRLYQGILQIGVAFYQLGRGNHRGAVVMLERGSMYLEPCEPVCQTVDVTALRAQALRCLEELRRLGPENLTAFDRTLIPKVKRVS